MYILSSIKKETERTNRKERKMKKKKRKEENEEEEEKKKKRKEEEVCRRKSRFYESFPRRLYSVYIHSATCSQEYEREEKSGDEDKDGVCPPFPVSGLYEPYGISPGGIGSIYILQARGTETTVVDIRSCYAVCYLLAQLMSRHKKH